MSISLCESFDFRSNSLSASAPAPLLPALSRKRRLALVLITDQPPFALRRGPGPPRMSAEKFCQRLEPYPSELIGFGPQLLARGNRQDLVEQLVDAFQAEQVVCDDDNLTD